MLTTKIRIPFNSVQIENRPRLFQRAIQRVVESGYYILGQEVDEFEKKFANYLGSKYCVGVGNGLGALQISLMALGVGKGDQVITSPVTSVATALAIMSVGAKPVFVDIDEEGLIDLDEVEKHTNSKTKAILPVHLYGQSPDLLRLIKLCKSKKISLVEDACQAHGSTFSGKKLGSFGQLGCFSFYPTKNLAAIGDGGAIVTESKKLYRTCKQIRNYGERSKNVVTIYGINSRLDEIQASILTLKLASLDKNNDKRRSLARRYIKNLRSIEKVRIVTKSDDSNFHLFVIRAHNRNDLQKFLRKNGINTIIHYPSIVPDQPFLNLSYKNNNFPKARQFVKEVLSLPMHAYLSKRDVDYVSKKIVRFYRN